MRWFVVLALVACSPRTTPAPPPPTPTPAPRPATPDAAVVVESAPAAPTIPTLRLGDAGVPLGYDLRLEVDPAKESFSGSVEIKVRLDGRTKTVFLHASRLSITMAAHPGGAFVVTEHPNDILALEAQSWLGPGELAIRIDYTGKVGDELEGLFRQRVDKQWFLYGQSESTFARRIAPCFDEPRFKVPWKVTLVVPKDQVAIANAPIAAERALADGRREIAFQPIDKLSSYLVSLAVGPFVIVDGGTVGRLQVPFRIATWASRKKQTAFAIENTARLVQRLETYLDRPIPVAKLDFVAVPQFFGAMENPGLVTFDTDILLGNADDMAYRRRFLRVAAHELAHQWTGNLVTPAWWDDLWLSEAFATFLGDKAAAELGGFDDEALRMQIDRADALSEDSGATPRAIRTSIAVGDDIDDTFDAIAYEKGRAVLVMFELFVGGDAFRSAMRAYIAKHAGGTATTADFIAQIAKASSYDVGKALASNVEAKGTPIVDLALQCTSTPPVVTATARAGAIVPVCVRYPGGRTCGLVGTGTWLPLDAATGCPPWVVGNDDGKGYYLVAGSLPDPALDVTTPAWRLAHGADLAGAVERGELRVPDALKQIAALASAKDIYAKLSAVAIARSIDPLVDDAHRKAWRKWVIQRFPLRGKPITAADRALRLGLWELLPPYPRGTEKQFAKQLARAKQAKEVAVADMMVVSLGDSPAALAPKVVALALDSAIRKRPAVEALATMLEHPATRAAAWTALAPVLDQVVSALPRPEQRALAQALGGVCDSAARERIAQVIEPALAAPALAELDRCVSRRMAAAADVAAAFPK